MDKQDSGTAQSAGISLRPVDKSDITAVASVYTASFRSDQYSNLMLLDREEDANQRFITQGVEMWLADPNAELVQAIDASGAVVGWVGWILKGTKANPEETASASSEGGPAQNEIEAGQVLPNPALEDKRDDQQQQQEQDTTPPARILSKLMQENLFRWEEKTMKNQRYLVLQALATHPRCQRQGVGSKLVQRAVDRADELGIPCWTQASPASHTLYARFGFQEVGKNDYDLDEWAPGGKGGNRGWGRYTFRYMVRLAKQGQ